MSICSFQSASRLTRPCWIRTREKRLILSNVSRVKSPLKSPSMLSSWLTSVDDACLHLGGRIFVQASMEIRRPLGLKQIVEDTHLPLIICPTFDFPGAGIGKLAVGGWSKTQTVEE